jgi:transposase
MKIFIGCDVSKGYGDFIILSENYRVLSSNFQLDDTHEGHCQLYSVIEDYNDKHKDLEIFAAVESTGGYENNWYNTFKNYQSVFNLKVARINPLGVNFNRLASMKRNVTDAISAQSIAEYMIGHAKEVDYDKDNHWTALRRHWNFVEMQKKQKSQTINQLETLLYSANPTLMQYRKDGFPNWLLELIIQCPTSVQLANAVPKELAKIPYIKLERAEKLVSEAKQSIASATDKNTEILVQQIALQIKRFEQTIDAQMAMIKKDFNCQEIELLKSVKGIDTVSAIGLMLEIGTIKRFSNVKAMSCYFGLHPKFKQSGDKIIGIRMSKQGSANMRKILFNIAKCAIVYDTHIKQLYENKVAEGMTKMAAIGLCMHKMLRIIYGILKNNKPYDAEIDKENQKRSQAKEQEKKTAEKALIEKTRRYQPFDSKAPISKKQSKKRKEHASSQGELISQNTGSTCSKKDSPT